MFNQMNMKFNQSGKLILSALSFFFCSFNIATAQVVDNNLINSAGEKTEIKIITTEIISPPTTAIQNTKPPVPVNKPGKETGKINTSENSRNCVTKQRENPYAITRAEFEKLPPDRQQFILGQSDKYAITDK